MIKFSGFCHQTSRLVTYCLPLSPSISCFFFLVVVVAINLGFVLVGLLRRSKISGQYLGAHGCASHNTYLNTWTNEGLPHVPFNEFFFMFWILHLRLQPLHLRCCRPSPTTNWSQILHHFMDFLFI